MSIIIKSIKNYFLSKCNNLARLRCNQYISEGLQDYCLLIDYLYKNNIKKSDISFKDGSLNYKVVQKVRLAVKNATQQDKDEVMKQMCNLD